MDAVKAAWWEALHGVDLEDGGVRDGKSWLTAEVFERAVTDVLETCPKLPPPADFLTYCEINRDELARERARVVPQLPAPAANVTAEIDPNDPYSCTAEERERWAREDAWIRTWSARRRSTPTELLARLSEEERAKVIAAEEANDAISRWPQMRPDKRRAKGARTEGARLRAIQGLRDAGKDFAASLLERIPPTYDRNTSLGGPAA